MKKWETVSKFKSQKSKVKIEEIIEILLENRGLKTKKEIDNFLNPRDPNDLTPADVGIDESQLNSVLKRLAAAVKNKESVVVYADYDADGITAGAIMWETLYKPGAKAMPYIPHRVEEGYGLSKKGIEFVKENYHPQLIVTVDHGVTAYEKIEFAKKIGIEVIVTDHHVKPKVLPKCLMVHTTKLSGAGISWFVAKEFLKRNPSVLKGLTFTNELIALTAIGTIADMVPLVGANRSIAKYGLSAMSQTKRVGLRALINDAGITTKTLGTYDISHIIAPRLNAMGRIEHALDALRLLCTNNKVKAEELAKKLGLTNKERQQMTLETTMHALGLLPKNPKKLIFVSHTEYNQGVIGLVAGKIVEEYYRPAIVVAKGEIYSKASARSISGFNIVEAIRSASDLLVDVGGHPMAAGFTVETEKLSLLRSFLEKRSQEVLDSRMLTRTLKIDLVLPLGRISQELYNEIQKLSPFGMGNPEPTFMSENVMIEDMRTVGEGGKHLKIKVKNQRSKIKGQFDGIGFGMGERMEELRIGDKADIIYAIDENRWNGKTSLQLKIKDIKRKAV